jgi:hypothetical protein
VVGVLSQPNGMDWIHVQNMAFYLTRLFGVHPATVFGPHPVGLSGRFYRDEAVIDDSGEQSAAWLSAFFVYQGVLVGCFTSFLAPLYTTYIRERHELYFFSNDYSHRFYTALY